MLESLRLRRTTGAALCMECGKCTSLCPLAQVSSPAGALRVGGQGFSAARAVVMGRHGHAPAFLSASAFRPANGDGVDRCLTCGLCEERCPQGVRFTSYIRGLRELRPGPGTPCPHGGLIQAAARLGAGAGSGDEREGTAVPRRDLSWLGPGLEVATEGPVGLFVGCSSLFELQFREELGVRPTSIAESAVRLLNRLGIAPVILAEERCCGHDLLWEGDRETFARLSRANVEAFQARGVRQLLTACAECARTWRLDVPAVVPEVRAPGRAIEVLHLAEFLVAHLGEGELTFRPAAGSEEARRVTFQDPCRLGRHLGVVDAPRHLLAAVPGAELAEMERSGRDAVCCGTAGFLHCDADSRALQHRRLEEAAATGAEKLLTACPKCFLHLACAQSEDQRRHRLGRPGRTGSALAHPIEVEDLTVFLASALAPRREPVPTEGGQP